MRLNFVIHCTKRAGMTVQTSGANHESSSLPANSSSTRNSIQVAQSDDNNCQHEMAHDIESYASAVPKKTDAVMSYEDNRLVNCLVFLTENSLYEYPNLKVAKKQTTKFVAFFFWL